jgi:CDP-diacylglycerol--serine O-phosphatidyltransferase
MLKVDGDFGKQLDSLADMVTFGLAPGLMILQLMKMSFWMGEEPDLIINSETLRQFSNINGMCEQTSTQFAADSLCHSRIYHYFPFVTFLVPIFAMLRLAKFNIDSSQSKSFKGLPTPAMTMVVIALPLMIAFQPMAWQQGVLKMLINPYFLTGLSVVLAVMMVVRLPLFALKFDHFKFKGNEIRYIFLTLSVVLLATLYFWALPIIVALYILLSLFAKK